MNSPLNTTPTRQPPANGSRALGNSFSGGNSLGGGAGLSASSFLNTSGIALNGGGMGTSPIGPDGDLNSLLSGVRETYTINVRSLERSVGELTAALSDERTRFEKLKEDFVYNLKLLEERDAELDRNDRTLVELTKTVQATERALQEAKADHSDLLARFKREQAERDAEAQKAKEDLANVHDQLNDVKRAASLDAKKASQDAADAARAANARALETADAAEETRRALMAEHHEDIRRVQNAAREREEMLSQQLAEAESAASSLRSQLSTVSAEKDRAQSTLELTQQALEEERSTAKSFRWESEDASRLAAAKLADTQASLDEALAAKDRAARDYEARLTTLAGEKDAAQRAVEAERLERERALEAARISAATSAESASINARAELDRARGRAEAAEAKLEDVRREAANAAAMAAERAARDLKDAEDGSRKLREMIMGLEKELSDAKDSAWQKDVAASASADRISGLETTLAETKAELDRVREDLNQARREVAETKTSAATETAARERKIRAETAAKLRKAEAAREAAASEANKASLEGRTAAASEAAAREAAAIAEAAVARAESEAQVARMELDAARTEIATTRARSSAEVEAATRKEEDLRAEVARLKAELKLSEMLRSREQDSHEPPLSARAHSSGASSRAGSADSADWWNNTTDLDGSDAMHLARKMATAMESENKRLKTRLTEAEQVNGKIRGVIATMRADMEALQSSAEAEVAEVEQSAARAKAEAAAMIAALEAEIRELRARNHELAEDAGESISEAAEVVTLRKQVAALTESSNALRAQVSDAGGELAKARASAASASSARDAAETRARQREERIQELETTLAASGLNTSQGAQAQVQAARPSVAEISALAALQQENSELRSRLMEAERDLRRLHAEKEKLLEIGNSLRADLDRTAAELSAAEMNASFGATSALNGSQGGAVSALDASTAVAHAVERAERELSARYEARSARAEDTIQALHSRNAALRDELDRVTSVGRYRPSSAPSGPRAWQEPPQSHSRSFIDNASMVGVPPADTYDPTQRPASAISGSRGESRARERLAEVQAGLTLAGSAPPKTRPRPKSAGTASARTTASQAAAKTKMASLAKQRSSLAASRRAVRNYSAGDQGEVVNASSAASVRAGLVRRMKAV